MKITIIDNYDSFTYNLAHLIDELGCEVKVFRNDKFDMADVEPADKIVLSPGPGIPSEAGKLMDVIKTFAGKKPILGVCLGHQAIAEAFGGSLINLQDVYHGVQTPAEITARDYIFDGLGDSITVGRYHSWVVNPTTLPSCLEVTALADGGQIMGLRHTSLDIHGIQFHPESVLTPDGKTIMMNFINKFL